MEPATRELRPSTAGEREATVASTGGEPAVTFADAVTPYVAYTLVDKLLTLQQPRSTQHDEMTFFISGQVMELLFKLAVNEVGEARDKIDSDDVETGIGLLRRVVTTEHLLVNVWPLLDTLSPNQYNGFRDALGKASGFQSYMYRTLEFILGNKDPNMLKPHRAMAGIYQELLGVFNAPSVWDSTTVLLKRRGYEISPDHLGRDVTRPYTPDESVEQAWLAVYRANDPGDPLYRLGEVLMEIASAFSEWQMKHLVTVERLIGRKVGSGGTAGVGWLRKVTDNRLFPELWSVRTLL
ncbi:MAG: hypothetical protein BGO26_00905 [Actinobacteria bacterium 69-20]|jgi:tryptophan 2,3-dioxygenase|nr:tryptophan 2,3-dioxygenase [Actinomycetota bacterium]OJV28566.1 MAG: hypothetical protein BGO26_00905 [Actinobacteria bacterium 69-20]